MRSLSIAGLFVLVSMVIAPLSWAKQHFPNFVDGGNTFVLEVMGQEGKAKSLKRRTYCIAFKYDRKVGPQDSYHVAIKSSPEWYGSEGYAYLQNQRFSIQMVNENAKAVAIFGMFLTNDDANARAISLDQKIKFEKRFPDHQYIVLRRKRC